MLFNEMNLCPEIERAIADLGFEKPSEIQEKSIPLLLENNIDFIGQAQTGTGKTAAFAIPMLEKIDYESNSIQAIILAPTRELANQIHQEINKLGKYLDVRSATVYGGVPISGQVRTIKKSRPHIIVGTPGRVLDLLSKNNILDMKDCVLTILDEADEMLDMGFFEDVTEIINTVDSDYNWMFSATMPKPIFNLVQNKFNDPEIVKVTKKVLTNDSVEQQYVIVGYRDMSEALSRYLDFHQDIYGIIFTRTKIQAKELAYELNNKGFPSDALHGDMVQDQRDLTMARFKKRKVSLLVCTDVAARGIDVNDLTHVINYGLPQDNEAYVHRIGRTGRAGNKGVALSIIEPKEFKRIRDIERITKAKIDKVELPNVDSILERLSEKAFTQMENSITSFRGEGEKQFEVFKEKFENLDKEELLKGMYSYIYANNFKRYKDSRSLEMSPRQRKEGSSDRNRSNSRTQRGYERFYINVGSEKGLQVGELIRYVASGANVRGGDIGKIDIKPKFSFFEVPNQFSREILEISSRELKGSKPIIEVASADKAPRSNDRSGGRGGRRRSTNRHR